MVFACGSRFVDDPDVYWPRDDAINDEGKERLRVKRTPGRGEHKFFACRSSIRLRCLVSRNAVLSVINYLPDTLRPLGYGVVLDYKGGGHL